ncbi:adenylyl-sulfate kinase [Saccharicrinis sp. FJH54]|uniref:adenylyl-sulfate kinase n=1 Tax=Saccharicrinis sp. FJH54 TaxID=3344665 RepID=UPI0035D438DF
MNEIHPIFDRILQRKDKEKLLNQRSVCVWFTGFSGSGKSTLAINLEQELHNRGFLTQILDGDNIRSGINKNLTFSKEDRAENIRRISEVTKLFVNAGVITLNTFISPRKEMRDSARGIIGKENFIEVFVNAPIEVCEQRDTKGLYKKARAGEIKNFTGIDAPFEVPEHPDVEVRTDQLSLSECTGKILNYVLDKISK